MVDVIQEAKDLKVMVGSNGCYVELEIPDSNGEETVVSLPFGAVRAMYNERFPKYIIYSSGKEDYVFKEKMLWGLINFDGEILTDDFYRDIRLIDNINVDPELLNRFLEFRIGTEKDCGRLLIYDMNRGAFLVSPPIERYNFCTRKKIVVQTLDYPNKSHLVCHIIDLDSNRVLSSDFAFVIEDGKNDGKHLSILGQNDPRLFQQQLTFYSYGVKPYLHDNGVGFEIIDPFRGKLISRVHINEINVEV